jgi:hypothetical protein
MSDETPEAEDTPTVSSTPAEPATPEPATVPLHDEDLPTAPVSPPATAPEATAPLAAPTPDTYADAATDAVADGTTTPPPVVEHRSGFFVPKWLGLAIAAVVAALVFGGIGYAIGDSSHGDSTSRDVIEAPGVQMVPGNRRPLPGNGPLGRPGNGNQGNGNQGNGSQNASGNGFLGVKIMNATGGAQITAVQSGSPAANGGLQTGDLITAVNGTSITSASDLAQTIGNHNSGDQINVTYTRNGTSATTKITLSAVPTSQNS